MAFTKLDRENLQNWLQLRGRNFWNSYKKIPGFAGIGDCPKIILNGRIYATAGYCIPEENLVELSLKLYRASIENQIHINDDTLPHELAHQIDYNLFGWPKGKKPHGPQWRDIMIKIGRPPTIYHDLKL